MDNAVIAGKTGTTNSNKDMWFCGYSAYYTTAVWIGFDYPKEIQGHNSASYIFKQYMTHVHENLPRREISIYSDSGQNETQSATEAETESIQETTGDPDKPASGGGGDIDVPINGDPDRPAG